MIWTLHTNIIGYLKLIATPLIFGLDTPLVLIRVLTPYFLLDLLDFLFWQPLFPLSRRLDSWETDQHTMMITEQKFTGFHVSLRMVFSADTYKFGSETMAFYYLPVYHFFLFIVWVAWLDMAGSLVTLFSTLSLLFIWGGIMASLDGLFIRLADIFDWMLLRVAELSTYTMGRWNEKLRISKSFVLAVFDAVTLMFCGCVCRSA